MEKIHYPGILRLCGFLTALLFMTGITQAQKASGMRGIANLTVPASFHAINIGGTPISLKSSAGATWQSLGPVTSYSVSQCSVAGDATDLYVFYREPRPDLNQDQGIVKQWSADGWSTFSQPTAECHNPDIDVEGSLVVAGWETDSYDHGFGSNANGPWVSFTGTILSSQFGTRVAIAQHRGYVTYAARYSDGQPFSYMMLHIDSPLGPGTACTLDGGWRVLYKDVGTSPQIAGDENSWLSLSTQGGWIYASKGYVSAGTPSQTDLGDGFRKSEAPQLMRAAIRAGIPTAMWTENNGQYLYIAEWDGSKWNLVGGGTATGSIRSLSCTTLDSTLYIAVIDDGGNPRINVITWDGQTESMLDGQAESSSSSSIPAVDITTFQGNPTVAFVEDGVLKVETYSSATAVTDKSGLAAGYELLQNYPNPFNPTTTITYAVPKVSHVEIKVLDMLGRVVTTLVDGRRTAGEYSVNFDGSGLTSGVYFCRIVAGAFTKTTKLTLLK